MLRLWRPMAGWTALVWAAGVVVFVPLSSALLGWSAFPGAGEVVGNQDLLGWILSAPGIIWVVTAGALFLAGAAVRYAGLFRIVTEDLEGRQPTVTGTLLAMMPGLGDLLRMCSVLVVAGLVVSLLFGVGLWGIGEAFLGAYDLNYYLEVRPTAWWYAVAAAAGWCMLWLLAVGWAAGRSLLAVPAWIDGHRPLGAALRRSWRRTRGGRGVRFLWSVALTVGLWFLARGVFEGGLVAVFSAGIPELARATGSLWILAAGSAAALAVSVAVEVLLDFLGFSTASTVLTKAYLEDTYLHARAGKELPGLVQRGSTALERFSPWMTPARIALVAGGLVAMSLAGGGVVLEGLAEPSSVDVVAHRGGPGPAPENTLAALDQAVAAGADFSEIDVQRTRDGVPVVAHDADLMRMAGDRRRISEHDWASLQGIVKRMPDGAESAVPVEERRLARLDEFLERARGRIGLVIELKYYGRDTALASTVIREVRRHGMTDQVAIMSLNLEGIRTVRRLAPEIRTGYASAVSVGNVSQLPVDFLTVARQRVTAGFLRTAHDGGLEVHAWTVNRPAEMAELARRGVDGLVTDRPGTAVRVLRDLNELPAAARLVLRFQPYRLDVGEEAGDEAHQAVP